MSWSLLKSSRDSEFNGFTFEGRVMVEEEDDNSDSLLADSTDANGLRVVTSSGSHEDFLNEFRYVNVHLHSGQIDLGKEDLDGVNGYACDTSIRTVRYLAYPSRNREILYIVKVSVDPNSLIISDENVGYTEIEKNAAVFQSGGWSMVREI
jgi:hypothetical protein